MTGTSGSRTGRVRVLIVDDETALTELLPVAATEAALRPCPAGDGQSALRIAHDCVPHAGVLDGMPPDLDGRHAPRRLRYRNPELPVPMLTARNALEHRVDGLDAGADDHVTEPFSLAPAENSREVRRDATPNQLTAKETALLGLLPNRPRQMLSKAQIMIRTKGGVGYAIRPVEDGR